MDHRLTSHPRLVLDGLAAAIQTKTGRRSPWQAGGVTEIRCYLHGIYPRSEALVAATRDAGRGRRLASDVLEQRLADGQVLAALHRDVAATALLRQELGC
jgi:hypothetical protein